MKMLLRTLLLLIFLTSFAVELGAQQSTQSNEPTNLTATKENWMNATFVKLQWQGQIKSSARDMAYFNIYRKDGAINDSSSFKKLYKNIFINTWEDINVQKGNTYSYFVTATNRSGESKGSDTVSITLDSASVKAVVTGTIKDQSTGSAIPKARISFIPVSGWDLINFTADSTGAFSTKLEAGNYIIYSTAPGYVPEYYDNTTQIFNATKVTVKSGDSLNFDITLAAKVTPKKYTLSGNVSDSLGNPLKADIEVYNVALNAWSRIFYHANTDSSGNYSLQVKQGDTLVVYAQTFDKNYIPQFYNGEGTFQSADRIPISGDITGINFVLLHKPVYNNGISGKVINSDSIGVPSIIQAIRQNDTNAKHRYAVKTDSLGNYSFTQINPGQYILLVIPQNGYKPTFFRYDGTQTLKWKDADSVLVSASGIVTGINFNVTALSDSGAATVNGHIKDNSGSPLEGAFVYAVNGNQEIYSFGISDKKGNYTISGLIPGSYSVTSQLYGYNNSQSSTVSLDYSSAYSTSESFTLTPDVVTAVIENASPAVIGSFELNQNYPNPFNPSTTINFKVPNQSKVSLKVYNILGSEVATLVNETKAAGSYNITFNASRLSSGVYFYQLKSGNFTSTKKLILMK
jgi:protocatechuate 3,4-dioxygenase beta subunit